MMIQATTPSPQPTPAQLGQQQPSEPQSATDAFGLGFDSLLKIVLTQLTYQDPLKPMENFEFVSQLAQFSQIQQTTTMSDSLTALVRAQATGQAAGMLGKQVDISANGGVLTGTVSAVSFLDGTPVLTIETVEGNTISGLPLNNVTQIRENQ